MILYNITTKIRQDLAGKWLEWQQQVQIPEILATGFFESCQLFHLLDQDESEGLTYVIQFRAPDQASFSAFSRQHEAQFRQRASKKWGAHYASFHSSMQLVQ